MSRMNLEGRKALEAARKQIDTLRLDLNSCEKERDEANRAYRDAVAAGRADRDRFANGREAHTVVLLGDRDALTRALEVCTRRLASPTAEKDPSRGGWRSSNMSMSELAKARG